jgi:O6-methylguanine-DNA--protein-cysteine methyltransferase
LGEAMARNPAPLIIPYHRVLAAGGKIGGFSAPGGADKNPHARARGRSHRAAVSGSVGF